MIYIIKETKSFRKELNSPIITEVNIFKNKYFTDLNKAIEEINSIDKNTNLLFDEKSSNTYGTLIKLSPSEDNSRYSIYTNMLGMLNNCPDMTIKLEIIELTE